MTIINYLLIECSFIILFQNEAHLTKKDSESVSDLTCEATRPYLCTGFDMYLAWEPCPM